MMSILSHQVDLAKVQCSTLGFTVRSAKQCPRGGDDCLQVVCELGQGTEMLSFRQLVASLDSRAYVHRPDIHQAWGVKIGEQHVQDS